MYRSVLLSSSINIEPLQGLRFFLTLKRRQYVLDFLRILKDKNRPNMLSFFINHWHKTNIFFMPDKSVGTLSLLILDGTIQACRAKQEPVTMIGF